MNSAVKQVSIQKYLQDKKEGKYAGVIPPQVATVPPKAAKQTKTTLSEVSDRVKQLHAAVRATAPAQPSVLSVHF